MKFMKKTFIITFTLAIAAALLLSVQCAYAMTDYVDGVVSFAQGNDKNGDPIDPSRSDPTAALGAEDGAFVSLGYGGELILSFPIFVGGNLTITAYETTYGSYPEENADVYVSDDAVNWALIGTASNLVSQPGNDPHPSVFDLGDDCIKYVKLVDATDSGLHGATSDGFDIDAVKADYDEECCPCEEEEQECCEAPVVVVNNNRAFVGNHVEANANTGGNGAGGSEGGDGGDGGKIVNVDGGDVEGSTTGSGGNGGSGDIGGTVYTGDATAEAGVMNVVNTNRTIVNRCACADEDECECGPDIVYNRNRAIVLNGVYAQADTGENGAGGSEGGDGGDGGKIVNVDGECGEGDVEDSTTGAGGAGGDGGPGGLVSTGVAVSSAGAINVVNRNVTRIRR